MHAETVITLHIDENRNVTCRKTEDFHPIKVQLLYVRHNNNKRWNETKLVTSQNDQHNRSINQRQTHKKTFMFNCFNDRFGTAWSGRTAARWRRTLLSPGTHLLLLLTDRQTETELLGKLVLRVQSVGEVDATHATVGVYLYASSTNNNASLYRCIGTY